MVGDLRVPSAHGAFGAGLPSRAGGGTGPAVASMVGDLRVLSAHGAFGAGLRSRAGGGTGPPVASIVRALRVPSAHGAFGAGLPCARPRFRDPARHRAYPLERELAERGTADIAA